MATRAEIADYLKQAGFLPFETEALSVLLHSLTTEAVTRMILDRKAIYMNFTEGKWSEKQFRHAIQVDYFLKEAYIVDEAGHKHAEPSKLLQHYKTFSAEEDKLIEHAKETSG